MRIEQMSSGLYSVIDSEDKLVLCNVSKHIAVDYVTRKKKPSFKDGRHKKRKENK